MIEVDLPPEGSLKSKTDYDDCGKTISVHAKKYTHPKNVKVKKPKSQKLRNPKLKNPNQKRSNFLRKLSKNQTRNMKLTKTQK